MATDLEERLNRVEGRFPLNSLVSTTDRHVHSEQGIPVTVALLPGRLGGQIIRGDTASSGTLTLYGGTTDASTLSRIIIGSDAKFATASVMFRNASDQPIMEQVSGNQNVSFPGRVYGVGGLAVGSVGGPSVLIDQVVSGGNEVLTWGGPLQALPTGPATPILDPILRDRAGVARLYLNSNPASGGHVYVNGNLQVTGLKFGSLLVYEDKTDAIVVKKTATAAVKTGTGTGNIMLPPFDHTLAANTSYRIEIDTAGTESTATYRWSDTGGGVWNASGVAFTGQGIYVLNNGVEFVLSTPGTFALGDRWDFTAIGTANQVELIRADTTADTLFLRNVNLSATTTSHESILEGVFDYTGASTNPINYVTLQHILSNSDAVNQTAQTLRIVTTANRGGTGLLTTTGLWMYGDSGASQTAPWTKHSNIQMGMPAAYDGSIPGIVYGLEVGNLGGAGVATSAAIRIDAQTGSTALYNIWQAGTTGVNRLAAPTLIGADASPAAGLSLDVTGDAAVSSQLHVGASTVPAAGVALQLTGGYLKMAASANNYIADSAGLRHITFASSTTVVATTTSVAGDLRVNDQLGVGGAVSGNAKVNVQTWHGLGAGTHAMIRVNLAGQLTANATAKKGFDFLEDLDLGGFNLTTFTGVQSYPGVLDNVAGTSVLTNYAAFEGGLFAATGGPLAELTNSAVFWAAAPQVGNVTPVTNHAGVLVKNQGDSNIVNAIGVDIAAPTGASGLNIGLRNAGTSLLVGEVEMDGALNHDGANVGFYGTAPATQQTPTGSRAGNAALASLLTALALTGIIVDGTSA